MDCIKIENDMETEEATNSDGGGSRKRPLDGSSDGHEGLIKRSNISEDDMMNLKIMIPSQTAGALIGKHGETIASIQKETGCRIKMSKSNDFFPYTSERLVLISGQVNCVLKVVEYIVDKTKEKYDASIRSDPFDHKQNERWKEIKLVIPSSAAGMIIGKAGEYIKSIKEQTGAFVQISPKEQLDHRLLERVVTIVGNSPKELTDGAQMIADKLMVDPNQTSNVYTNVSYRQIIIDLNLDGSNGSSNQHGGRTSPGLSQYGSSSAAPSFSSGAFYPGRRSYSPGPQDAYRYKSPTPASNNGVGVGLSATAFGGPGGLGVASALSSASASSTSNAAALSALGNLQVLQFLDGLRSTLRSNGFNEQAITEIMHAMQVLAKYNVLGLGLGFGLAALSKIGGTSNPGVATGQQQPASLMDNYLNNPSAGLNSAAFLSKDMSSGGGSSSTAFGAVGAGRQPNIGFAGFDSPMMDINENYGGGGSSSAARRSGGGDRGGNGYGSSADYVSRDQPLYVSRSSGSRYDDSVGSVSSSRDYASGVVKEFVREGNKLMLTIPETIVGAVLGKAGRNLLDIQHYSGAKVEVSKRGQYVSGTQDRCITVTGNGDCIRIARMRIEKSINDEQMKRESRKY